ncbi:MAG TPA: hypothetical protein VGK16_08665 [Candidatus Limnocylindrales bacterium]|jgi:hypothetical protein
MSSQVRHIIHRAPRQIVVAAMIAAVAIAGPVAARETVDPNTLNPAPPDFFNAECYEGAGGTLCTLHFSDDPIVDEPSGIVCGSTELLFSQERSVVGKRTYDGDGNLVQRHFRETLSGTFTNPHTGTSVPWFQHDTIVHDLSVPGDLDSGTIRTTGLLTRVWVPGGGSVLLDAGTILEDSATGDLIHEGGMHPFRDYFANGDADALQALCDALG